MKQKWRLGLLLVAPLALLWILTSRSALDAPYILLTGYSQQELEELSYLPQPELTRRIGLGEVPQRFSPSQDLSGRAAHVIASYLGTRRWGPNVTIALGYLRECVPALLQQKVYDPTDIAANYAGVEVALREIRAGR